jgi:hypothetical protein
LYPAALSCSVHELALALALCRFAPSGPTAAAQTSQAPAGNTAAQSSFQLLVPPQQQVQHLICRQLLLRLHLAGQQPQLLYALTLSNLETGQLAQEPCRWLFVKLICPRICGLVLIVC